MHAQVCTHICALTRGYTERGEVTSAEKKKVHYRIPLFYSFQIEIFLSCKINMPPSPVPDTC